MEDAFAGDSGARAIPDGAMGVGTAEGAMLDEEAVYKSLSDALGAAEVAGGGGFGASAALDDLTEAPWAASVSSKDIGPSFASASAGIETVSQPPAVPDSYPLCPSSLTVACDAARAVDAVAETLSREGADFSWDSDKFRIDGSLCIDGYHSTFKVFAYAAPTGEGTLLEFQSVDGDRTMVAKLYSNFRVALTARGIGFKAAEVPAICAADGLFESALSRVPIAPCAPPQLSLGRDMSDATASTADVSIVDVGEDSDAKLARAQVDTSVAMLEAEYFEEQAAGAALLAYASKSDAGSRAIAEAPTIAKLSELLRAGEPPPALLYTLAFALANAARVPSAARCALEDDDLLCSLVERSVMEGALIEAAVRRESLRCLVHLAADAGVASHLRKKGVGLAISAAIDSIKDARLSALSEQLSSALA